MNVKGLTASISSVLLGAIFVVGLSGCSEGGDDSAAGGGSITESPCQISTETFDASGAEQPKILLAELPPGEYQYENSEIYVDHRIESREGNQRDPVVSYSRIHFLEREIGTEAQARYETGRRCFETKGTVYSFLSQSSLLTEFTKYNDTSFDTETRVYNIDFRGSGSVNSRTTATLTVNLANDNRSVGISMVAGQIANLWNGGYVFARRSGDVYEFHGIRLEASRTVYGKVVYTRKPLPANSR